LSVQWEKVLLLGSPDAISAAGTWRNEAWHLESFARKLTYVAIQLSLEKPHEPEGKPGSDFIQPFVPAPGAAASSPENR
jgi:hypothetical protein